MPLTLKITLKTRVFCILSDSFLGPQAPDGENCFMILGEGMSWNGNPRSRASLMEVTDKTALCWFAAMSGTVPCDVLNINEPTYKL